MCKRLSAALLFVFLVAPVMSGHQGGEWIKVAPAGGGFSIMMPAKPEEEVTQHEDFTMHLFTVTIANAIYLAGYGDYAPSIRLDPAGELAANRDTFVKGLNATLLDSRSITLDGRPGLEFTAESDQASFKSRVYLFGNRVHQVAVAVPKGKDDTANVNRFFASFAFTKP
jgi:hypothetical protein